MLDIHEEEKKGLTVEGLLEKFKTGAGKMLDNDRILLSGEKNKQNKEITRTQLERTCGENSITLKMCVTICGTDFS